jgi:hypothetical protein
MKPKHIQLLDEDTGELRDWILFNCPRCNEKYSLHALAYYDNIVKRKGKTYGRLQVDENNYYCMACGFQGDLEKQSAFMKRVIAEDKKDREKFERFPDEQFANTVSSLKASMPGFVELFDELMYDATTRDEHKPLIDLLRNSRRYKMYPKSSSDYDRLFMALHAYSALVKDEEAVQQKGIDAFFDELHQTIKNDS